MKKATIVAILAALMAMPASAYNISGMYASLLSCEYGEYAYQYGYIGLYKGMDGHIYEVFFGRNYCEY